MSNIACGRCEVGAEVYDGVCRARDYVWVLTEVRLGSWGGCAGEGWVEMGLEERAQYEEDLARYTQYIVGQKVGTEEIMPIGSLVLDWSD